MKNIKPETQGKINQLQMIEETLQQYAQTKQTVNTQILEIDSALLEIEGKKSGYKIVGTIMIEKSSEDLKSELLDKKKSFDIRISTIEKHEEKIKTKFESLQKEVMNEIKDEKQEKE